MKIISAEVIDRRTAGVVERPHILVDVEERTEPTSSTAQHFENGNEWYTRKYGPFINYGCDFGSGERETAGHFNVAFRNIYDPIVDVEVFDETTERELDGNWGLTLRRARQLVRRFDGGWRLLMNDRDGQDGLISWTPVRHGIQHCLFYIPVDERACGLVAVGNILDNRVEIPMCKYHFEERNAAAARQRIRG